MTALSCVEQCPSEVTAILSSLKESITRLEDVPEDTGLMRNVISACNRLIYATADPLAMFQEFNFQPQQNACVRIAIEMGLFDRLPVHEPFTSKWLATCTKHDPEFTRRVIRGLAASNVLEEVAKDTYRQTKLSRVWASQERRDYTIQQWENFQAPVWHSIQYFRESGFKSPQDPRNSPITFGLGERDKSLFEIIGNDPGRLQTFNNAMKSLVIPVSAYRFDSLQPGNDNVLLVDVGGGNGSTLQEICSSYSDLKGRVVLQDIKGTIASVKPDSFSRDIEVQAYDFLAEKQPVKGAAAYLYKLVFHDWSDSFCCRILANLKPAMSRNSRILICDKVVPETSPPAHFIFSDLNMLFMGGKERTLREWTHLLDTAGYVITKTVDLAKPGYSIIEAALKKPTLRS